MTDSISGSAGTNAIVQGGPNYGASVLSRIQSASMTISSIQAQITAILAQISAMSPPASPGADASDEAKKAYANARAHYSSQMGRLRTMVSRLQERLDKVVKLLQRLTSQDLPAAERKDADELRKQAEQAQQALKMAAESLEGGGEDSSPAALQQQDNRIKAAFKALADPAVGDPSFLALADIIEGLYALETYLPDDLETQALATALSADPPTDLLSIIAAAQAEIDGYNALVGSATKGATLEAGLDLDVPDELSPNVQNIIKLVKADTGFPANVSDRDLTAAVLYVNQRAEDDRIANRPDAPMTPEGIQEFNRFVADTVVGYFAQQNDLDDNGASLEDHVNEALAVLNAGATEG